MKIRKDYSLENDIISLIGMACTGGALIVWAKETFRGDTREIEEEKTEKPIVKPGKYEIKI